MAKLRSYFKKIPNLILYQNFGIMPAAKWVRVSEIPIPW